MTLATRHISTVAFFLVVALAVTATCLAGVVNDLLTRQPLTFLTGIQLLVAAVAALGLGQLTRELLFFFRGSTVFTATIDLAVSHNREVSMDLNNAVKEGRVLILLDKGQDHFCGTCSVLDEQGRILAGVVLDPPEYSVAGYAGIFNRSIMRSSPLITFDFDAGVTAVSKLTIKIALDYIVTDPEILKKNNCLPTMPLEIRIRVLPSGSRLSQRGEVRT